MPHAAALAALLQAYREQIDWLIEKARDYEQAQPLVAADYLHRAHNLQATIDGYERLNAKNP